MLDRPKVANTFIIITCHIEWQQVYNNVYRLKTIIE